MTSLAEQLRRLQTPQSSQFVDTKKRDSILFNAKEAATKSRETIYEIGISGLLELIELNQEFEQFQSTLFELTAKDFQRAVENKEVNALIDKNIQRFMYHLSPYFMIPASHKCLEWLIRRFNINLYNKEEFLTLILPYHQTNMFVRCIQSMKFDDPTNKWDFLSDVKKTSAPLSKYALWNHGATQPSFIGFVGKFTYEAIKELGHKAGSLQTMLAFYCTTLIGAMEHAPAINNNHILFIARYLIKAFKSKVVDFAAAGYMITAQLLVKAKLGLPLLNELMEKITNTVQPSLTQNVILLLSLMFQSQTDELKITEKSWENIVSFKWLASSLQTMKKEGKPFIAFYRALICKLLEKIGEKQDFEMYKDYCMSLMAEVDLEDDEAQIIIRSILDSYTHVSEETTVDEVKKFVGGENEDEIISLDSDDEEENIPLKSEDVTLWYSTFLKSLERSYPLAFDEVVKDVMSRTPGSKRNGLKNVLGFLLKVSCANNETNIFENLYHHNAHVRTEAVAFLVQNFNKINLNTNENGDILKLTITERLNDDNPNVFLEVLNISTSQLIELIGADELVAKLTKVLMKYWKSPEKWSAVYERTLQVLTSDGVFNCSDPNIVLIAVLPFLTSSKNVASEKIYNLIKDSKFGKSSELIKSLPKKAGNASSFLQALKKCSKLPSSASLLNTIKTVLLENKGFGSISVQFSFLLLANAIESTRHPEFSFQLVQAMKEVLVKRKLHLVIGEITDTEHFKSQEIPAQVIAILLKEVINKTTFAGPGINFSQQDVEIKLKLEIFQFLVEKFFAMPQNERSVFNDIIKTFLDVICESDHLTKLQFFSQFCTSHVVYQDSNGTSLELQIRSMRLLNHVLLSNQENAADYPNEFFQNILISLTAEQAIIRESGCQIVSTLCEQNIPGTWKFLFEKLDSRNSEILMDSEQLGLILFLISSKKASANVKHIIDGIVKEIESPNSFDYIRSSLLMILKHLNDKKVLDVMSRVALQLIDQGEEENVIRFNDHQSSIIKIVLMKINQETLTILWNLATKSLDCHRLLSDDDGKHLTPSSLVLKAINEDIYLKLHSDRRTEVFNKIVKCSMNEHPRIVQAAQKIFQNIDLDCKIVKAILMKMPKLVQKTSAKKGKAVVESMENPLTSSEWKVGVTLLELLQNKTKGLTNQHELIVVLFDVLDNCLHSSAESSIEYTRQIVLSLLLITCQKVSPDGKAHRLVGIQDGMLKTELVIRCIKESENPQTHHHSLLLLAQLAIMSPDQVLNDMMTIFTFVGTTLIRQDDSYSFQIISRIIENVVPMLASGKRGDDEVIPIIKIFASIVLQVPEHRRLMLYVKLLSTLDVDKFLWKFVGLVIESQVVNHQKGTSQEELPPRIQAVLAIAKEFEVKTILDLTTSLIKYVMELPMFIDNKTGTRTTVAGEEKVIFSLKTHTETHLRHFKYLVLQFLKTLLSSPEIKVKVDQLSKSVKTEMKGIFQDVILNVLRLIPEIKKTVDHERMKPLERSWNVVLYTAFDILEASIELLAPDMLLLVVEGLLRHEDMLVRKKVIELLNRKLEEKYFDVCDDSKLVKLMIPLKKICSSIGESESNTPDVVQQSALMTIKLLARKLTEDNPEEFIDILEQLTSALDNDKIKTPVLINLVICIAELIADLKVQAIGMLGRFMPNVMKLMTVRDDDPAALLLLFSVVSALLRIIETLPLFLSPYLSQIIAQLTRLSPGLKLLQDGKISLITGKISKIWSSLGQLVPTRVLIPAIDEVYEKTIRKEQYASVEPLMDLMFEIFQNIDGKDVKNFQSELIDFFIKAMQFRCEVEGKDGLSFKEVNDIEMNIIRALVALVMKLSEGSFRPLFESVFTWAIKDEPDNYNRAITFFRLTNEVSMSLKSLFLLFSSELIDSAGPMLDKCNPSKHDADSCFGEDKVKYLYLTEFILRTLNNIFLHDHQNFINTQRFDIIMQPIVDQIENDFVLSSDEIQKLVRTTVAQLATAASDDILWKQLNYQVLMKTRSDDPAHRIFGVQVCVEMAKRLGEDFEPLVPETIPFLSELLEDEDYKVVEACQNGVRELETTVGESLQKYF